MGKMTPEQKEFNKLSRGSKDYWLTEALKIRHHRLTVDWVRKGVPELTEYADSYHKGACFILGSGPSLERVKAEQWDRLGKFFTVGVNRSVWWLQKNRDINNIPALGFCMDYMLKGDHRAEYYDGPFSKMGGKRLVAMDADGIPHEWAIPHFQGAPILDLDMGVFLSVEAKEPRYSRSTMGAVWLCYLLGFKAIFLLGADHGPDYGKHEPAQAVPAFRLIRITQTTALVFERGVGHEPALSATADDLVFWHAHIGKEHLVERGLAGHRHERAHLDARCVHLEQQIADALVFGRLGFGAHETEYPIRVLRARSPDLLSVDDKFVAVKLGLGRQ